MFWTRQPYSNICVKKANRQKSETFTLEFANFGIKILKQEKVELVYLKQRVYIFLKNSPPPFKSDIFAVQKYYQNSLNYAKLTLYLPG